MFLTFTGLGLVTLTERTPLGIHDGHRWRVLGATMKNRPALILAWTVPLTFLVLAAGAVIRDRPISGEAWGAISAILGAVVAGTYAVRNNNDKGGKDE